MDSLNRLRHRLCWLKATALVLLLLGSGSVPGDHLMVIKGTDNSHIVYTIDTISRIFFIDCGNAQVSYEGTIYNTIHIGNQCWLKENLDVGMFITSATEQSDNGGSNVIEKYCYENIEANCTTYGALYMWDEAMRYTLIDGAQGICPENWRIPTVTELDILAAEVGGDGNSLKAIGQGSGAGAGTDTSGFSALLSGYVTYLAHGKSWGGLGTATSLWSSTEYIASLSDVMRLTDLSADIVVRPDPKGYGVSVRCILDLTTQ